MTLNDVFPMWMAGKGIFSLMAQTVTFPWSAEENISNLGLDLSYHGNHSGNKEISPLLNALIQNEIVKDFEVSVLADVVKSEFLMRWEKLWDTLKFEYNPIENYSMIEEGSDTTTDEGETTSSNTSKYGRSETHTGSNKSTTTYGRTEERSDNSTDSAKNALYGFNSANPTDDSSSETKSDSSGTLETGGQDGTEGSNNDTMQTGGQDENSGTTKNNSKNVLMHRLTRSGNIGVTTSQQMLESERQVWQYKYFEHVYEDLDTMLVSRIYEREGL